MRVNYSWEVDVINNQDSRIQCSSQIHDMCQKICIFQLKITFEMNHAHRTNTKLICSTMFTIQQQQKSITNDFKSPTKTKHTKKTKWKPTETNSKFCSLGDTFKIRQKYVKNLNKWRCYVINRQTIQNYRKRFTTKPKTLSPKKVVIVYNTW